MKSISCSTSKRLQVGSVLKIIDNSGATKAKIIAVKRYGGVKRRYARAGIADIVICTVLSGKQDMRHTLVPIVIVQQKGAYKRADGTTVRFYQNAGIMLKNVEEGEPKGSVVKEPVAKEVIERFIKIGRVAKVVV
jgi:large subunit ribosomal protein L14